MERTERTAADTLAFASEQDAEEFIAALRKYEAGEITPDAFRAFRLARGCYGQRQPDVNMLRVKLPQGVLEAAQLENMADLSEKYSRGYGHVTTRQNLQFHMVKLDRAAEAMADMAKVDVTTREACGGTVRNVTACPIAGVCGTEAFDVTIAGEAITQHFLRADYCQTLPRKFKIALSGCSSDCALGAINDVGLIAQVRDGQRGFKMKIAGGLSSSPQDAYTLHEFIAEEEVLSACEAVVRVFDRTGNRQNKARARLKYVLKKIGFDGFKVEYEKEREGIRGRRDEKIAIKGARQVPVPPPTGPAAIDLPSADEAFRRWHQTNVKEQKQPGYRIVTVRLIRGDITAAQFRGLAALCREHSDGTLRLTIEQNLVLRYVPAGRLQQVYRALLDLDLGLPDAMTVADVVSCPGAETCNLAVTASRELATAISDRIEVARATANGEAKAVEAAKDLRINISGCPNSCGQHHIGGIGFHGTVRKYGQKVAPEYELHLGGGVDAGGATFGRRLLKIPARRVPDALLKLLQLYEKDRQEGETAVAFFRRVPVADAELAIGALAKLDPATAKPEEYTDNGSDQEFKVAIGVGECAA